MTKAYLKLASGEIFTGYSVGATGKSIGEVVFNTSMTGYTEVLTDPSYFGQIVTMTYPLMGNYGVNEEDSESTKAWVSGFIMREYCEFPSNFRNEGSLDSYLKSQNIIGLYGIDTRHLTKIIREQGVVNGVIYTDGVEITDEDMKKVSEYLVKDAVKTVTREKYKSLKAENAKHKVALLDLGTKYNIENELVARGCDVDVYSGYVNPEEIIGKYDGFMLSNGPGDPAENVEIIENIKKLIESNTPIFGICLGHQLLSLAIGCKTEKLKYGHRGGNHPVLDLEQGRTYITSQNHGYAVVENSVPEDKAKVSHINLNDKTVEGLIHKNHPVFSVQYHPEACPGPQDNVYLFDKFVHMMSL
ncbi:MAG: carbamoyl phosphate synthase small subunit [Clostridia bacterium]